MNGFVLDRILEKYAGCPGCPSCQAPLIAKPAPAVPPPPATKQLAPPKAAAPVASAASLDKIAGKYVFLDKDDPDVNYWDDETPEDEDFDSRQETWADDENVNRLRANMKKYLPEREAFHKATYDKLRGERNAAGLGAAAGGIGTAAFLTAARRHPVLGGLGAAASAMYGGHKFREFRRRDRAARAYAGGDLRARRAINDLRPDLREKLYDTGDPYEDFIRNNQDEYDRLNLEGKYKPKDWDAYLKEEHRKQFAGE